MQYLYPDIMEMFTCWRYNCTSGHDHDHETDGNNIQMYTTRHNILLVLVWCILL